MSNDAILQRLNEMSRRAHKRITCSRSILLKELDDLRKEIAAA